MKIKSITITETIKERKTWTFFPRRDFEGEDQREIESAIYDYACARAYGSRWSFWQNSGLPSGYGQPVEPFDNSSYNCGPRISISYEQV